MDWMSNLTEEQKKEAQRLMDLAQKTLAVPVHYNFMQNLKKYAYEEKLNKETTVANVLEGKL